MVAITLPDGSKRTFDGAVTGAEIAADIGPGLAKAALAVRIDGQLADIALPIEEDAAVAIVTGKDGEALDMLRHDCAHLMAEAVKEIYPETQVTIGPNIEDGFFYDFSRPTPFTPEDLEKIEARMHEIVKRDEAITREVWDRGEAVLFFKGLGEHYKAEIIESIPGEQEISLYRQGDFIDLCRGPHFSSTAKIGKAFKLMKLAGAYWRGDSRNEMLQRIYGTAWFNEKDLNAYLHRLEEAEKRDHRRLGREMGLFHFQEEAAGSTFWHDKGWTLYRTIQSYIRSRLEASDYIEVSTPQLVDRTLWEKSGHWEKFRENMFTADAEEKVLALKPMNCPCHVQIFKQG
ncbi:MAG: TGS domain-containing protein, partial [Rhodospirillaceae bacterium]|nr:TGS domain-containing protein [Rhodospirillaceae bacterium]